MGEEHSAGRSASLPLLVQSSTLPPQHRTVASTAGRPPARRPHASRPAPSTVSRTNGTPPVARLLPASPFTELCPISPLPSWPRGRLRSHFDGRLDPACWGARRPDRRPLRGAAGARGGAGVPEDRRRGVRCSRRGALANPMGRAARRRAAGIARSTRGQARARGHRSGGERSASLRASITQAALVAGARPVLPGAAWVGQRKGPRREELWLSRSGIGWSPTSSPWSRAQVW
jgi:hypothetical protein